MQAVIVILLPFIILKLFNQKQICGTHRIYIYIWTDWKHHKLAEFLLGQRQQSSNQLDCYFCIQVVRVRWVEMSAESLQETTPNPDATCSPCCCLATHTEVSTAIPAHYRVYRAQQLFSSGCEAPDFILLTPSAKSLFQCLSACDSRGRRHYAFKLSLQPVHFVCRNVLKEFPQIWLEHSLGAQPDPTRSWTD